MRTLDVIQQPAAPAVSLSEAKEHARVDHDADDALIGAFVGAATSMVESEANRALVSQVVEETVEAAREVRLMRAPVQAVTSVVDTDTGAAVDPAAYTLRRDRILFARERSSPVTIRYACGYGLSHADVPDGLRMAVARTASHLYEHREDVAVGTVVGRLPDMAARLVDPFRRLVSAL